MVEEVSKVLAGHERSTNRYFRLVRMLYGHYQEKKEKLGLDVHIMQHVHYSSKARAASICVNSESLPKAQRVLELFAFSLALFLEFNGEESGPDELEGYRELMEGVVRTLEEGRSSRGAWLRSWMAGDRSILVDPRYVGWRSEIFGTK